jgi:2-dehydropantoate 2-reductase
MKFGIMACGGVGGYFGGLLSASGNETHFVARGKHLESMSKNGLQIKCIEPKDFIIKNASFTEDPKKIGACDVILFCVKTISNKSLIPAIEPMVGKNTTIINLQNGVDNEKQLVDFYGKEKIMGGAAYIFTSVTSPGVISQIGGPRKLVFGELDGVHTERSEKILNVMKKAKINAFLSQNILKELWTKFIFICAVGGMTALTRSSIGEIMKYEGTKTMTRSMMKEVYDISKAEGINLPIGTDEDRFNFIKEQDPSSKGSLCHDLEAGKKTEIDSLCGFVSKLGEKHKIPTPINDFVCHTIKFHEAK